MGTSAEPPNSRRKRKNIPSPGLSYFLTAEEFDTTETLLDETALRGADIRRYGLKGEEKGGTERRDRA